jgi:hypothetical protein
VVYGSTDGTNSLGLDGEGRVQSIWSQNSTSPVTAVTYNNDVANQAPTQPIGAITGVTYGSGDSDSFTYNVATGLLTQYQFNVGSQSVVGGLGWNQNGTLGSLQISDQPNPSNNQTCGYTYDDLGRIASVNCLNGTTNVWNQNFGFDVFGNITKTVPTGGTGISFQPTSYSNNQFALSGGQVTYDANGNLTNDLTHTYHRTAEATPSPLTAPTSSTML